MNRISRYHAPLFDVPLEIIEKLQMLYVGSFSTDKLFSDVLSLGLLPMCHASIRRVLVSARVDDTTLIEYIEYSPNDPDDLKTLILISHSTSTGKASHLCKSSSVIACKVANSRTLISRKIEGTHASVEKLVYGVFLPL